MAGRQAIRSVVPAPDGSRFAGAAGGSTLPKTVMCMWFMWLAESLPRSAMKRQPSLSRVMFQMCWFQIT